MKTYTDVVIQAINKKDLLIYTKATKIIGKILIEMGALRSTDMVLDVENSKLLLSKNIKLKKDQVLILATAEFKNKTDRNKIIKKMHDDSRLMKIKMPKMNEKQSIMAGYKTLVDLKK